MSEITALYYSSVKELKRISNHAKYSGRANRWIDSTTGKSFKELQNLNSEMKVYVMDKLLSKEEFYALDLAMQKQMMEHWRNTKTTSEIRKALNLSAGGFYSLLKKLELPTNIKGKFGRGDEEMVTNQVLEELAEEVVAEKAVNDQILESLLEFTDKDTGDNITKRLNIVSGLISGDSKYQITVSVKKVVNK